MWSFHLGEIACPPHVIYLADAGLKILCLYLGEIARPPHVIYFSEIAFSEGGRGDNPVFNWISICRWASSQKILY